MNMTKCPVLIAFADQIVERTGRVRIVAGAAIARSVQQTDIEPTLPSRRIGNSVVLWYCTVWKAATVKSNLQIFK
jgi:hypothetical protein